MLAFFDGDDSERHGIRPFAGVDDDGRMGIGYTRVDGEFGPFYGDRSDDIVTSIRGLLMLMEALENVEVFTDDLIVPCWYLGRRVKKPDLAKVESVVNLVPLQARHSVMGTVIPELDGALAYILDREYDICVERIYDELKAGALTWTAFTDQVVADVLLMVRGQLTPDYQKALHDIQAQRAGAHSTLVEHFIAQTEAMLDQALGSVEKAYRKLNATIPNEAEEEKPKHKGNVLTTITRRFRRSELFEEPRERGKNFQRLVAIDRLAVGEAIQHLHAVRETPPLYPEMKVPNYHNNLMRLARSLYNIRTKAGNYLNAGTGEGLDIVADVKRQAGVLLCFVNMAVREQMSGVYSLGFG